MGDMLLVGGLIFNQIVYGSLSVLLGQLLAMGFDALFLVTLNSLTTAIVTSPLAFFLERGKRPPAIGFRLLMKFVFLSLGGVCVFQALIMMGIKKTSPAIASAMPNLVPGLVFVIAGILRLEKVDMNCRYSWAKIVGTLLCLFGAIAMSFLHRSPGAAAATHLAEGHQRQNVSAALSNETTVVGCMYLLGAVFTLARVLILQANTLVDYPAPLSLCVITSLMGSVFTAALELAQDHKLDPGSSSLSPSTLCGLTLVLGAANAACFSIQGWSVTKRGPVLVSMFSPVSTVCSAILSSIFLGDSLSTGSIFGMTLIFMGLYLVLWAKKKEGYTFPVIDGGEDKTDGFECDQEVTKHLIT